MDSFLTISGYGSDTRRSEGTGRWACGGLLLLLVVVLIRSWHTLVQPAFAVEDSLLFSQYYGAVQPLADVVQSHFGQSYVTLVSNGLAWLYALADVRLLPYLYQWTGFVFSMAAACCLFFSGLIRSRVVLLFGPLLMGLTAINHIYYWDTLIYVMYTAVILLLALMVCLVRVRAALVILLLPLLLILPWAGPYSVLVVPTGAALLLLHKQPGINRLALIGVLVSTAAYFLTVRSDTVQLAHLKKLGVIRYYLQALLDRVIFIGQFDRVSPWFWPIIILLVGVSFYLFRRDRYFIKHSLVFFGIIISSLALFYLSIKFPLYRFPNECHLVISLYFWCFFMLYAVDRWFTIYGCGTIGGIVFPVLLLLLVGADNIRHPQKYGVTLPEGAQAFVEDVHAIEQLPLKADKTYVVLRLINPKMPFFQTTAIVGSREKDARRLAASDLPTAHRSVYLVQPQ